VSFWQFYGQIDIARSKQACGVALRPPHQQHRNLSFGHAMTAHRKLTT
jgi:hypothetical protein